LAGRCSAAVCFSGFAAGLGAASLFTASVLAGFEARCVFAALGSLDAADGFAPVRLSPLCGLSLEPRARPRRALDRP
jgi:hypothetical protein